MAGAGLEPERRRRSPLHVLPILLVLIVVGALGVGAVYGYSWLSGHVSIGQAKEEDYTGSGSDKETVVEVSEGDSGSDIAATLVDHDVIKSSPPFVRLFGSTQEASQIQPGSYRLNTKMSSSSALDALMDPSSLTGARVTIPEGMRMKEIFERMSKSTGIPVKDFEKAASHYTDYGIPKNAANSPEGYLWPGRYDIPEDATAGDVLTMMWERMDGQLDELGVKDQDRVKVLTLASITEKEVSDPHDYGMAVRTMENRLEGAGDAHGGSMKLQLDSTVSYVSDSDSVSTTHEQRAKDSPYNTYLHEGLPIGPISNPGRETLEAAVHPPKGEWLYWVTVDTKTGETKFADTYSEHEKYVQEWKDRSAQKTDG
ncbi:endolytic transglycosylase MltG [Brachybacterium endophyticum]|uniref:Endolytic murein transglycosylase n=1 Tax=Brachybacterium endophyticum TaxID=2182385 RepID=A0A2U2RJ77_9MICO|nr:endolytic transglycosylase MltG [Brachybacterium endophyticum]